MASYTPNINLKKPTTSEYYNVLDENQNKDKIDTAIGTINSQIGSFVPSTNTRLANALGAKVTTANNERHLLIFTGAGTGRFAMVLTNTTSAGTMSYVELYKGDNVTLAASDNYMTYTISGSTATSVVVTDFALQGNLATVSNLS